MEEVIETGLEIGPIIPPWPGLPILAGLEACTIRAAAAPVHWRCVA